jgi:hypothetical protein
MGNRVTSLACAAGLAFAASPALAQGDPVETCVGKVRLHGPIWSIRDRALEPGLDVVFDTAARTIRERCGAKLVIIEAHAYEMPAPELNLKLSELRAAIVRHELVKRGVAANRLLAAPFGDTRPLTPIDSPDAAERNRRITFRVAD